MTKSSLLTSFCILGLLFGVAFAAMGIMGFSHQPRPGDRLSPLLAGSICSAMGGAMILAFGGALFLLARSSYRALAVTAATVADLPLLFGRGMFQEGFSSGRGIVVARPGFVTFVPLEPIKHLLGDMAKTMALHVVGVQELQVLEPKQILEWLDSLRHRNPGKFDLEILKGAERRGAITWRAAEVEVLYDAESLAAKKFISFRSGKAMINFNRKLDVEQQKLAGELSLAMARRADDATASSSMWLDE